MKIKEGFVLRKMGDQAVVVSVGSASKIFNGMIKLNESGEFLWHHLTQEATEEELVEALLGKYEVSEELARKDVAEFIKTISAANVLEG